MWVSRSNTRMLRDVTFPGGQFQLMTHPEVQTAFLVMLTRLFPAHHTAVEQFKVQDVSMIGRHQLVFLCFFRIAERFRVVMYDTNQIKKVTTKQKMKRIPHTFHQH